uniref:calphotin-like n=1 Tax=Monopterus albus TaxID=43700 RepID=UPI0009B4CC71|nr:calphotin-like [Monopterus albus]
MGNTDSRRQDTNTAATEEKTAESGITHTQEEEAVEDLDVVVGEPVEVVGRLPHGECVLECLEAEAPSATLSTRNDPDPEPVHSELLVSASEPPSKSEPAAEAQLAPEPFPEPEPSSNLESEVEAVCEPTSKPVPAPAKALEQQSDMLTQESLPEPVLSSPLLINPSIPGVTPKSVNTPPSPAPIPAPVNEDKPSDVLVTGKCQDSSEAAKISMLEPGKPEETSESLAKPTQNTEKLDLPESGISERSVSGLLKNLELEGNDLATDLIVSDVKIPDDTPITDISTSTEQM